MTPDLSRAASARRELVERLKLMFPAETEESLGDTVEGLSDFNEVVLAAVRAAIEREAMAYAIDAMIGTLESRKQRLVEGEQKLRAAALQAMQEAGKTRINGPDMTLSVSAGKGKVVIVDEEAIPAEFVLMRPTILKRQIGEALKAGAQVPGATLSNPVAFLTVRRT